MNETTNFEAAARTAPSTARPGRRSRGRGRRATQLLALGGVLALATTLGACGSDPTPAGGSGNGTKSGKDTGSTAAASNCPSGTLSAEGSTAQKNAIEQVISAYQAECPDVTINYNPTGSGNGIKQFNAGQVDFAGSDSALKTAAEGGASASEADAAAKRCGGNPAWNLPMVVGPIGIAYNVAGVDGLVLDGPTAAGIFTGKIKTWDDPKIAKINPNAKLPKAAITVFFRSDESGTTENFEKYLQAAGKGTWTKAPSKTWAGVGSGRDKSAGVTESVKSTANSITYVEWSYAQDSKLSTALVDNGSGPVALTAKTAGAALTAAKPSGSGNDLRMDLAYDTSQKDAYPIVLVTYEVVCSKGLDASKTKLVKSFLTYFASAKAQGTLEGIGSAPLPEGVRTKVAQAVEAIQ